jgi:hypothetical protein
MLAKALRRRAMAKIDTFDKICLALCALLGATFVGAALYFDFMMLALIGSVSLAGLLVPLVRERSRVALALLLAALIACGLFRAMAFVAFLVFGVLMSDGILGAAEVAPLMFVAGLGWLAPVALTVRSLVRGAVLMEA